MTEINLSLQRIKSLPLGSDLILPFDQLLGTLSCVNACLIILNSKSMQISLRRASVGILSIPDIFLNFASYTDFRTSSYVIGLFNER